MEAVSPCGCVNAISLKVGEIRTADAVYAPHTLTQASFVPARLY
jgi:hypothetical protein